MAHGDPITPTNQPNNWSHAKGNRIEKYLLLDAAASGSGDDANGAWVDIAGADDAAISIHSSSTTTGADIQIRGSIPETGAAPSASDHGFQIGSDIVISSDTETDFAPLAGEETTHYIKARVSDYTDGTYSVVLMVSYR